MASASELLMHAQEKRKLAEHIRRLTGLLPIQRAAFDEHAAELDADAEALEWEAAQRTLEPPIS